MSTKIDHLEVDTPIVGQRFFCISFLSPEGIRNCSTRGIKIRGVYATYEEAKERASELQEKDPYFNVFIGEVGKWCPWDPDPNSAEDQVYQEEELQKLAEGYKENLKKISKVEQQRKQDMIKNAQTHESSVQTDDRENKARKRAREKLEKRKAQKRMEEFVQKQDHTQTLQKQPKKSNNDKEKRMTLSDMKQKEKELEKKTEVAKEERDRLTTNEQAIRNQEYELQQTENKLAEIEALYNKLQKK